MGKSGTEVPGDFGEKPIESRTDGMLTHVLSQTAKPAPEAEFVVQDSGNSPALGS
jgi:hypothetical protein